MYILYELPFIALPNKLHQKLQSIDGNGTMFGLDTYSFISIYKNIMFYAFWRGEIIEIRLYGAWKTTKAAFEEKKRKTFSVKLK